ncbi:MAG: riboflavin synthase [Gammaproteobacteria bacterium]|nr:MAG: riboflavin synthase [Gammaproteobacteria bacterium]TLY86862.1 MAG: riboflavin synthase [Gammaproteobacteria bacterium]
MFTGIVQDIGTVQALEARGGDVRLVIAAPHLDLARVRVGDSLCVSGCCLTATEVQPPTFAADLSRETLALTTLGELVPGAAVNLEPALRAGEPLGGHLLSGHVDGVGEILSRDADARSLRLTLGAPAPLERFLAAKGSVAVDGVSLTINAVQPGSFAVNIIPHTQAVTTLGSLAVGARVNLEVDQVARYLARLLERPQ